MISLKPMSFQRRFDHSVSGASATHFRPSANGLLVWFLVSMLALTLFGCAVPQIPKDAAFSAPPSVIQVKARYQAPATDADASAVDAKVDDGKPGNYILGPGDQLTVVIQRLPDATFEVAVRPDGYISLPVVDEVKAAGLTPAQLDQRLTTLFTKRLVDPDLSVIVRSFRAPMVYVLGEVARPGPIPFQEAASAAEAIARAGDILPSADYSNITIIRLGKDGTIRPLPVLPNQGEEGTQYQATPYMVFAATRLEPEDLLFIPEKGAARLGSNLEQTFKPVITTGAAVGSVLSPWLMWKLLDNIDSTDGSVNVNP